MGLVLVEWKTPAVVNTGDSVVRCEIEKQLDKEKCSNHLENFDSSLLEGLSDSFKQEIAVFLASQFMKNQKGPHSSVLNFDYIQPPAHVPWND